MPITSEELVRLLAVLAEEENLKVTVKETVKGGAIAGTGAVVGGLLGGPIGIAVGGMMGGMMARWKYKGISRPVTNVLIDLNKEQREQLREQCQTVFSNCIECDFVTMSRLASQDGEIREQMIQCLKTFITETLKLQLMIEVLTRGKAE